MVLHTPHVPVSASKLFRKRLKELRQEKGWSQEKAAEKCDLSAKVYQFYETGHKDNPGLKTIEKICAGFGISVAEFFRE